MTTLEEFNLGKDLVNIGLQILSIGVTVVTLFLALKAINQTGYQINQTIQQIKQAEVVYAQTLDWNKKMATDTILEVKPDRAVTERLNTTFHTLNSSEPIENLVEKAESNEELELDIHHLLNVYERLGRGMENDIYVESMIKDGLKNTFIKVYKNYEPYIAHRQTNHNPKAWKDFQKYALKWEKET